MNPQETTGLNVTLSHDLVAAFSRFSGDFSSLHTNAEFGRRSIYNSTVVHGMLPLLFVPLQLVRVFSGSFVRVLKIEGQFLKPLYPGDEIVIECAPLPDFESSFKVNFSIRKITTQTVVTRGVLVLEVSLTKGFVNNDFAAQGESLVSAGLAEQNYSFESIENDHASALNFNWGPAQRRAYFALVSAALKDAALANAMVLSDCGTFAMLSMLSTLVGMLMPGQTATFQEFSLTNDEGLQDTVASAQMQARVSFKSVATNVISQKFEFTSSERKLAHGKLAVLVAKSQFVPPTVQELAQNHSDFGLRDKVVLVTGASRGLGATTAKMFAIHGAKVVINYRSSHKDAQAVVSEIEAFGGKALAIQADVTIESDVQRMVSQVIATYGTIDVLINNAASNFFQIPFLETTWSKIQEDLDTIAKGAFLVSQAVLPIFLLNGGGKVVNVSTIATETPPPFQTKYVVAKSALVGLTRAMAAEFAAQNIQVNMVVPSLVETDFTKGYSQVALSKIKSSNPMKQLASAQDVADAIVFLSSPRSKYTTGQKFMVTGGLPPFL